ncbi:MAG: hypothetical protein GXY47_16280 [Acidobacteria bacterium]|nr:hypothetical protein [Acidobacteriota bacterium]
MNKINYEEVLKELSYLEGKEVSHRRIAGNTIILYFGGDPGDDFVTTLSMAPSWRYSKANEWLLGSGDLPWEKEENETDDDFANRFNKICDNCKLLAGSLVRQIAISRNSSDLEINFSGKQKMVSFGAYKNEENWVFNNRIKGIRIYGSLDGYEMENP